MSHCVLLLISSSFNVVACLSNPISGLWDYIIHRMLSNGTIIPIVDPVTKGFIQSLLRRGQMSHWGITVMINIVAVLPCCGIII